MSWPWQRALQNGRNGFSGENKVGRLQDGHGTVRGLGGGSGVPGGRGGGVAMAARSGDQAVNQSSTQGQVECGVVVVGLEAAIRIGPHQAH